jgi:hypothetical protein
MHVDSPTGSVPKQYSKEDTLDFNEPMSGEGAPGETVGDTAMPDMGKPTDQSLEAAEAPVATLRVTEPQGPLEANESQVEPPATKPGSL